MKQIVGRFRAQDNVDMQGHHITDWRHLSDIPQGGAATGQPLVWDGKSWNPGTVSGTGLLPDLSWDNITDKPTTFPSATHTHSVSTITDSVIPVATPSLTAVDVDWRKTDLHINDLYLNAKTDDVPSNKSVIYFGSVSSPDVISLEYDNDPVYGLGMQVKNSGFLAQQVFSRANSGCYGVFGDPQFWFFENDIGSTHHTLSYKVSEQRFKFDDDLTIVGDLTLTGSLPISAGANIAITANHTISATGVLTGLIAGTNISTNGSTVAVIAAPTFAATVTANEFIENAVTLATKYQGTLTASTNISITGNNTIAAATQVPLAGTNISTNGATVSVVDDPTFSDQVTISTTENASKTVLQITQGFTGTGFDVSSIVGLKLDMLYDSPAGGGTGAFNTIKGIDYDLTIDNNLPQFFGPPTLHALHVDINADSLPFSNAKANAPIRFSISNASSTQAWTEGFLSVECVGGTSGEIIAAYTRAFGSGTAGVMGYRGYAAADVTGSTGILIGVQGYVINNNGFIDGGIVICLEGTPIGSDADANKTMGLRVKKHVLIRDGSIFCATAAPETPGALSPTFVQATTNTGEAYIEGNMEVVGQMCLATSHTPSSASDTGTKGQLAWDNGFLYVCIATDTWERAPLASW